MRRIVACVIALLCAAQYPARVSGEERAPNIAPVVAGWVETAFLGDPALKLKVKLDTGAKTSSIHAAQYRAYEKDGIRRVSFVLTNNEGGELTIDTPVVRTAFIRRAGVEKRDRPVIRLRLCIAGVTRETEFTMADRSELSYPVLVGRSFLAGNLLVDPARTFIASGLCQAE